MKRISFKYGAAVLTTPQVPRYVESVENAPIQTPRTQGLGPEAFGAGLGQGLQRVGNIGLDLAKQERDKAVRTMTIEGRTKINQREVDLLYHPENGALAKKGKNTFGIEEPTLKAFDESMAKLEQEMTAPEARDALKLFGQQRRVEIQKQIQRHVSGETRAYAEETNKASLESTLNNVMTFYQDPDRVEQERKFGLGVIMSDTNNKGLPPEAVKMKAATWESMVHRGVIERMSVDSPSKAKEYFEKNRDWLLPTDAAKIEGTLKPLVSKQAGMDTALELATKFQGSTDPASIQTLEAEALKEARTRLKSDPDALNIAETQIGQMAAERVQLIKAEKEQAAAPVHKRIAEIRLKNGIPKLSDIPAEEWATLIEKNPEEAGQIQTALRTEREHADDRKRAEQDRRETKATVESITTWGMLKTNPALLQQTNLDKLLSTGKITKTLYSDLITDQLAIKQGKGEQEAKILSNKAAVDVVLSAVDINDKDDPDKYMKFYESLNGRMKTFEAENGAKPKQEDVIKLARGLLGEVSQDRNFWPVDKDVRVFEADPAKVRVPGADRTAIVKALKANKRPVTEENIRTLYLQGKERSGRGK